MQKILSNVRAYAGRLDRFLVALFVGALTFMGAGSLSAGAQTDPVADAIDDVGTNVSGYQSQSLTLYVALVSIGIGFVIIALIARKISSKATG